jgi:hypothetical protein
MPKLNADKMPSKKRVDLAKSRTECIVDHARDLLQIHETNAIVVYSDALSGQIRRSFAAIAFKQFQRNMHWLEIIRMCALWDSSDRDKENVPTVVDLVDDAAVQDLIVEETRSRWPNEPSWADKQANACWASLADAISRAKEVTDSPRQIAVMNMRHKHLAHSLTETDFERKGLASPMKYGDERWLLEETIAIIHQLNLAINGADFAWDLARQDAREHASDLWHNCSFN